MPSNELLHSEGHLLANLLHFGRLLRMNGIRVSTRQVIDLSQALTFIDITKRDDFYTCVRCLLVTSKDDFELFDQAFEMFWGSTGAVPIELGSRTDSQFWERDIQDLPRSESPQLKSRLLGRLDLVSEVESEEPDVQIPKATYSPLEILLHKDFSDYTEEDLAFAKSLMHRMIWSLKLHWTRRRIRASKKTSNLDISRAIRRSMKHGGEIVDLAWRRRKLKPRPLVVLCDISGSMEQYSRIFLYFLYALVQSSQRMETFVFSTRLTRITPALRNRDIDVALKEASEIVVDWSGGTRIGMSLKTFNYDWSRRVLGRGAWACIISDGWDRGDIGLLESEIARLHRSVHRLIWLNPLLGSKEYEPLVRGMKVSLPHIDDFLPFHNLLSLESLALKLGETSFRMK
ncbi:MAG: VWA domain-containing protein [Anaerolineales bacterium]|nr:VWA domain-containing protein [Anaerolineales bacterium]